MYAQTLEQTSNRQYKPLLSGNHVGAEPLRGLAAALEKSAAR